MARKERSLAELQRDFREARKALREMNKQSIETDKRTAEVRAMLARMIEGRRPRRGLLGRLLD
jgi:hypothetical protein